LEEAKNSVTGTAKKTIQSAINLLEKSKQPFVLSEISKERIRRAGKKILEGECHEGWKKDIGFRVLKIDSSNMADVYYTPDAIDQGQLRLFTDNIKPDRKPEDLLFQVLLDWGEDLSLPIGREKWGKVNGEWRKVKGDETDFTFHSSPFTIYTVSEAVATT
jgi:adenine-specific DNA-methyltransferase